ncbi:MAG: MFS transporter [Haloplanus sp.]
MPRSDQRFVVGMVSGGHFMSHFYLLAFPPLFPFILDTLPLSNTELGLIVSAMMFPNLVLQLPIGQFVDRVGAKRVFVSGLFVTGLATSLAGLAPNYLLLLVVAVVAGIGQSAFHPSDYALLSTVVDDDNEGKGFSLHTFGGFAGFAAAPVVLSGLAVSVGWRVALMIAGTAGVLYALFAYLTLDTVYLDRIEQQDDESSESFLDEIRAILGSDLVLLFVFFMLLFMAGTGIQTFTTVFLVSGYSLSETVGNSVLTTYFALSAVGILLGGVFADRFDVHSIIGVALTIAALVSIALAVGIFPTTLAAAFVGFGIVGFVSGMIRPSRDSLVNLHSPPDSSGRSFGFVFSGGSLGGFISPALLGYLTDTMTIEIAFVGVGVFFFACTTLVLWMRRMQHRAEPTPSPA